jgi:hypothetical protein
MIRTFFKYSLVALMIQMLVCIAYYWDWHAGLHMTPDWVQRISASASYFYLPAAYILGYGLKPFIGEGENAAACVWFLAPAVGTLVYALVFAALICLGQGFQKNRRTSHAA